MHIFTALTVLYLFRWRKTIRHSHQGTVNADITNIGMDSVTFNIWRLCRMRYSFQLPKRFSQPTTFHHKIQTHSHYKTQQWFRHLTHLTFNQKDRIMLMLTLRHVNHHLLVFNWISLRSSNYRIWGDRLHNLIDNLINCLLPLNVYLVINTPSKFCRISKRQQL